ncbi:hypothetical protein AVEN_164370-1 [Araneus ventricosus]|uniref:Uncharacterized protein n=1 Tax=Araneus ventricosus TaxID=182803 RepID=A0A4Y2GFG5_ARAVE|nr:hypothetical protein AVEN_164370-1 [Araneus ventricosus]
MLLMIFLSKALPTMRTRERHSTSVSSQMTFHISNITGAKLANHATMYSKSFNYQNFIRDLALTVIFSEKVQKCIRKQSSNVFMELIDEACFNVTIPVFKRDLLEKQLV